MLRLSRGISILSAIDVYSTESKHVVTFYASTARSLQRKRNVLCPVPTLTHPQDGQEG